MAADAPSYPSSVPLSKAWISRGIHVHLDHLGENGQVGRCLVRCLPCGEVIPAIFGMYFTGISKVYKETLNHVGWDGDGTLYKNSAFQSFQVCITYWDIVNEQQCVMWKWHRSDVHILGTWANLGAEEFDKLPQGLVAGHCHWRWSVNYRGGISGICVCWKTWPD